MSAERGLKLEKHFQFISEDQPHILSVMQLQYCRLSTHKFPPIGAVLKKK